MTQEEKIYIAKLIRKETGCGMMEASVSFDKLLGALKNHPLTVMDNQPYNLNITWEEKPEETPALTWKDIGQIKKILSQVRYEADNLPYDEIPWAGTEANTYKEVLRRFNETKK